MLEDSYILKTIKIRSQYHIKKGCYKRMEYHFSDRISNVRPSAIREILKYAASHPEVIALSTGSPANEAVPVEEISEISARIFKEKPLAGLQYSMTEGYPALRESTRQRL